MNRNIYKRIEVCFPVYNYALKKEIIDIIELQFRDNVQAVHLDSSLRNVPVIPNEEPLQSQRAIYDYLGRDPVVDIHEDCQGADDYLAADSISAKETSSNKLQ